MQFVTWLRERLRHSMATSVDDVKSPLFWRAVAAELLGTMFLVLVGAGSCTGWEEDFRPSVVQIALCFGLIVATMVWCIGHVSGGHINPAVTVAMVITRKVSVARALLFVVAQVIGALIGGALLKGITPGQYQGTLGCTVPHEHIGNQQAFGVEFLITFILVFTVFASCDSKRNDLKGSAPLTIGLSVTVCHLFAIKYTGAGMNPARSFGTAAAAGIWDEHWVYWCGPLLGGVVAALTYDIVFAANSSLEKARGYLLAADYDAETYAENPEPKVELTEITTVDNTKDNKSEKEIVLEKEREEEKKEEKKDEEKEKKTEAEDADKATEKTTMLGGEEKEGKYPE